MRATEKPKGVAVTTESGEADAVELSVRLVSGHFESSITVPLTATPEERKAFVDAWCGLMEAGIKVGSAKRTEKSS
jgi:hypothetical protein